MLQNGKQHKGRGLVRVVIRQAGEDALTRWVNEELC